MSTRTNFRRAARKIERLADKQGETLKRGSGLRVIGEEIETDVNATRMGKGVPRDEGILAGSSRVTGPDTRGIVRISYGGAAAPYAMKQHEDTTLNHPNGGEARFLVRGVERWSPDGSAATRALQENAREATRIVALGG